MKVLINTSTLYFGGGVQVALSFIGELVGIDTSNEYHILMSKAIEKQIDKSIFPSGIYFYLIEKSPASLKTRYQIINLLDNIENKIKPDVVFTVFGPSYWRPKSKHLIGFADGWLYNPNSIAYARLSIIKRLKMKLLIKYKKYYLKRDADKYVLETDDAKNKFANIANIVNNKIYVVGNTYSAVFNDKKYQDKENKYYIELPKRDENEFRFMYIAHNHPSKNLAIINDIIPLLENVNIKFILTIDNDSYTEMFKHNARIINIGPIEHKSCPSIYKQCDALFAPTLLETFSAAYPESMIMNKPILTSKYSFATETCKEAALYFDPLNPQDIADKIKDIVNSVSLREELINKGKNRIFEFETAKSRAIKYIDICQKIVKEKV